MNYAKLIRIFDLPAADNKTVVYEEVFQLFPVSIDRYVTFPISTAILVRQNKKCTENNSNFSRSPPSPARGSNLRQFQVFHRLFLKYTGFISRLQVITINGQGTVSQIFMGINQQIGHLVTFFVNKAHQNGALSELLQKFSVILRFSLQKLPFLITVSSDLASTFLAFAFVVFASFPFFTGSSIFSSAISVVTASGVSSDYRLQLQVLLSAASATGSWSLQSQALL